MTEPDERDPHGKRRAWRSFFWSFPLAIGTFLLGVALFGVAVYTQSGITGFFAFAIIFGGTLQVIANGFFELVIAHAWRPLWQYDWFQYLATAALLAIAAVVVYVAGASVLQN